jgi:two-component system sensor histidine kinase MprB
VTLRRRFSLLAGAAVAAAVAIASVGLYLTVRGALLGEVDRSLESRRDALAVERIVPQPDDARPSGGFGAIDDPLAGEPFGGEQVYAQLVTSDPSAATVREGELALPVGERERAVAAGTAPAFVTDVRVDGRHLRVLTDGVRPGLAVQLARPLDEVDTTLSTVRIVLAAATAAALVLGTLFGGVVAGAALRPLRRLGQAARRVRSTHDLGARVDASGRDEVAELAGEFNAMLEALETSDRAQRQLVADASHELRTPVTSLRTYLEFLRREEDLPASERVEIVGAAVDQVEELAALISDLVELQRGQQDVVREPLRLDLVVAEAVERARRRAPAVAFDETLEPVTVDGSPDQILRAVSNLVDNAVKWSPPGGTVEVTVADAVVSVRDRGPGIAAIDVAHVFDRFYRSLEARKLPGSGLGLAIVKQVAEAHGGSVSASNAPGGGALLRLDLAAARIPTPASLGTAGAL